MKGTCTKTLSTLLSVIVIFACSSKNNYGDKSVDSGATADPMAIHNEPFLRIEHKDGLIIYHITEHIVLSTEPMRNEYVELISSAAFTDVYGEIVGHYYNGFAENPYGKNSKDSNVTGGFISRPYLGVPHESWDFYADGYEAELANAVRYGNVISAFAQNIIIYKGVRQNTSWRNNQIFQYRALCEMGGELKIIESETAVPYNDFVDTLTKLKIFNALYLDMGTYNYLWYDINVGSNDSTIVGKTAEVKGINYTNISNFLNVWIAD